MSTNECLNIDTSNNFSDVLYSTLPLHIPFLHNPFRIETLQSELFEHASPTKICLVIYQKSKYSHRIIIDNQTLTYNRQ